MIAGRARLAMMIGVGMMIAAALAFALWWLFVRPRAAQVEAASAKVERPPPRPPPAHRRTR